MLLLPVSYAFGADGNTSQSLKTLYRHNKIELVPELIIHNDTFPEDVISRFMVDFAIRQDSLYIADILCNDIKVTTTSGEFKRKFGQKGKGPGDLFFPSHFTLSKDKLIIYESRNQRLSVFKPDGTFLRHVTHRFNKGRVHAIKALENGQVIIETEYSGLIKKEFVQFFVLELFSKDLVYKKEVYKKQILRSFYIRKPVRTSLAHPFPADVLWDVLPGNKIVIGYSGDYSLEIHDLNTGKVKNFQHSFSPVKVTAKHKKEFFDGLESVGPNGKVSKGAAKFVINNTEFPEYKAAFKYIFVDGEGNILVFLYGDDDDMKHVDVFDSAGAFINQVDLIIKKKRRWFPMYFIDADNFWVFVEHGLSERAIVKYKARVLK